MKPARFDYERAVDVSSAIGSLNGDCKVLAGGQSLGPMLNLRIAQPSRLVDVRLMEELRAASEDAASVTLGACVTHAQIEDRRVPDPSRGFMPFVASRIAYRAVRNRGTIGGSLAHADPAADWPTALALLGGSAIIQGKAGRREAPLDRFVTGLFSTVLADGELLVALKIPKLSAQARWGYWKFCRKAGEFAQAIGGALSDPASGRVRAVIGSVQGAPHVIIDAARCDPEAEAAKVCSDPYDRRLHAVALARAFAQLEEPR
ncbi:MAG TPA: FAD binding domain-containing protein [Burkholderiales bacterium]|nr:FAD binding domain-containing protein [Burkholderiales bacterium]